MEVEVDGDESPVPPKVRFIRDTGEVEPAAVAPLAHASSADNQARKPLITYYAHA
jgi:hypothetical protein